MNPLKELSRLGQSVWYDNIRRSLMTSGELARMVTEYGVSGITSNPVIFEKAITGADEYDSEIKDLAGQGMGEAAILNELITGDIRLAADVLAPVYRSTKGADGYVSIEVNPGLAHDAEGSVTEARHLMSLIDRPNVMVKIPGTIEGLSAAEELLYNGFNVNVTLLFSVARYAEVARAYVRALERRASEGRPVDNIRSVASFFVSRVDTLVDRMLEERAARASSGDEKARLKALVGRVAVANAKLAYKAYAGVFETARFEELRGAGAAPQKLLWASTGTKDPRYSDVKYVETLIAPGTVNTMPLPTLHAFEDHGRVADTLADGLDEAESIMGELEDLGISYTEVTDTLEREGLKGFCDGFDSLIKGIAEKSTTLSSGVGSPVEFCLGAYAPLVDGVIERFEKECFVERLWEKDATLWKKGRDDAALIRNSLGWLAMPQTMPANVEAIESFVTEVRGAVYKDAVLLGMGGSSLAPLVLAETFGASEGYPRLTVLDSTDPDAVRAVAGRIDPAKTLFIVSSKSGSTIEPLSLFEYFYAKVHAQLGDEAGANFVAITDPGSALEGYSRKYGFRHLFLNPSDIGGRFSALSYFGLVPAAIAGVDISKLLYYAGRVEEAAQPCVAAAEDPGLRLGAAIGALGRSGRDKLTLVLPKNLASFGLWVEQLVAESTGKEGKGIVPVAGEPLGGPGAYSDDRVFVYIGVGGPDVDTASRLGALKDAGHPVITYSLADPYEIGGEFLRWEIATAAAGEVLGINPFDQPDVELAKKMARERLSSDEANPRPPGVRVGDTSPAVYLGRAAVEKLKNTDGYGSGDAGAVVADFIRLAGAGSYIGICAYLDMFGPGTAEVLSRVQRTLRDATMRAVQCGYGPRYLHSTGQLHKGGAGNGVFIIITHASIEEEIPKSRFGFSTLELSQAYGDMDALDSRGVRVLLIHLDDATDESVAAAGELITSAVAT